MSVMIPIIKVKDTDSGNEHIVGTNHHDSLIIKGNALHYLNLQCMDGTQYGGSYEFVGEFNEFEVVVEFVTLEEFAKLYSDILKKQNENERQLQELFKDIFAEEEAAEKFRNSDGYIHHT